MTPQERKLWYDFLRGTPEKWVRQKVLKPYILDFYCHAARIAIEIDGGQHYGETGLRTQDLIREHALSQQKIILLRYTNLQIDRDFYAVCSEIQQKVSKAIANKLLGGNI